MGSWKNYFIYILVKLLRVFQTNGQENRFLIVSTTGLGDTLWATPAIRALREKNPEAYIGCLTTPLGAEVLSGNQNLNELFIFKNTLSLFKLYAQLKTRKIGKALLFHTSQRALLPLCAVIGTTERVGTQGLQKGLDSLLTRAVVWSGTHEIQRRLDIVGSSPATYELDFFVDDSHREKAALLLPEGMVVGLHPGAKDRFKQWPKTHFVKVGKKLKAELGCSIVVTGVPSEKEMVKQICQEIGGIPLIQPLKVMGAALEKMSLFIINDTGPMHLACAMKTPTLALFAPTSPSICGPFKNSTAEVLSAPPTCMPCLKKKCRDAFCMRQIGPDNVIEAALEKLKVTA